MITIGAAAATTVSGALRTSGDVERCGYLLGRQRSGDLYVERFLVLPHAGRRGWFSITEADVNLALRLASASDSEVLAILHAHPSGTLEPSELDKQGIRCSRLPWVIVVRCDSAAAGFRAAAYEPRSLERVTVCIG